MSYGFPQWDLWPFGGDDDAPDPTKFEANQEPVPFAWAEADVLSAAFDAMADEIEQQRPTRGSAAVDGMRDWNGEAVLLFAKRISTGEMDSFELVAFLRDGAEDVRAMKRSATEEQTVRDGYGRELEAWSARLAENERLESNWNKFGDWVTGEDFEKPPAPPARAVEPNLEMPYVPVAPRD